MKLPQCLGLFLMGLALALRPTVLEESSNEGLPEEALLAGIVLK